MKLISRLIVGVSSVILFAHEHFIAGACMLIAYHVCRVADTLEDYPDTKDS